MGLKTTKFSGNGRCLAEGEGVADMCSSLAGTTGRIQIAIKDSRGRTVRTVTMGKSASSTGTWLWEGKEDIDTALPAGIYSFSVNAINGDGTCA